MKSKWQNSTSRTEIGKSLKVREEVTDFGVLVRLGC